MGGERDLGEERRVPHLPDHPPAEDHCPLAHKVQQYCGT